MRYCLVGKLNRVDGADTWEERPFLLIDKSCGGFEKSGTFALLERACDVIERGLQVHYAVMPPALIEPGPTPQPADVKR